MPLYEYECSACGNRFEQIQKFSDEPVEVCPKCGKKTVQKLVSSPAIQFKGSGWYITEYAKKGGPAKDAAAPAAKDTDTKSSPSDSSGSASSSGPTGTTPAASSSKQS